MKYLTLILTIFLIYSCSSVNEKKIIEEISNLNNTKWIHQPFQDIPSCIDTLFFSESASGYYYSCEHEMQDSITFFVRNDTLFVDKYDYVSEEDASAGIQIASKYTFVKINSNLKMTDIKHRYSDSFSSVDSKFLDGKIYEKIY